MATGKFKANQDFNIDWSVFRANLQKLLDSRGYTKADFARVLDLSVSTISRYFYETTPDMVCLWLIADYFDVPIDWLIGRSESRWEKTPKELKELCDKYLMATESDRLIIKTLLNKYE
jgi:transcriptional regulator with XRE-family HTH domain